MKNHIRVDGKLLQTNKTWPHLKERQKQWIYETVKEEYDIYIAKYKRQPHKSGKEEVIDNTLASNIVSTYLMLIK